MNRPLFKSGPSLKFSSLTISLVLLSAQSPGQVPDFSKVPNVWKGDSLGITNLINNGIKITKGKAICWFPKDSLSEMQMSQIADTLSTGIVAAERFIKAPLSWQARLMNDPYVFYFRLDSFISHASLYGFVSVPFWRIKNGKAPWLHEALHEMLYSKSDKWFSPAMTEQFANENMPLWLHEGLPDFIAMQVASQNHLRHFDVFSNSISTNADSLFLTNIKPGNASYIISRIGSKGVMPELFSKNRGDYAPGFYHGSCSFVKFIVENYSLDVLLTAISSFEKENESIEAATGKPLTTLKKEWLEKLSVNQ
jgi:hypothetical protein